MTLQNKQLSLDWDQLTTLIPMGNSYTAGRHQILFSESQVCNTIIFIKSGLARQFLVTEDGSNLTKAFFSSGEFTMYSVASFITGRTGEICFETLMSCEIIEWPIEVFREFLGNDRWQNLLNQMLRHVILQQEEREISFLKDCAFERVNQFLEKSPDLFNKVPHYHIASYLGISPETLSRIRTTMKSKSK